MPDEKPWRDPNARKITFDEMTARAQFEWDRAEKAEAEAHHYEREASRLTQELEASRQREAEAFNRGLEAAVNYAERREAQWAEEVKHMRNVTLNTGKGSAAKQIADGIRALKSTPESKGRPYTNEQAEKDRQWIEQHGWDEHG